MNAENDGDIPQKVLKRIDTLTTTADSSQLLILLGIALPFFALFGLAVGVSHGAEAKRIIQTYDSLNKDRLSKLASVIESYKTMKWGGAIVLGVWIVIGGGITLAILSGR